jgi:hypothetical protein
MVGALSEGVDVSLQKKDIPSATKLNDDIKVVANKPSPEAIKKVIDSLDNEDVAKELNSEISRLVAEKSALEKQTLALVETLTIDLAKANNDKKIAKDRLAELSNPFTAIKYGITALIKRFLWTITGLGIVFLLLKVFAASNPVVGAIWSVVERLVGYIISAISSLFPMAIKYGSKAFQKRNGTLEVLVDTIQLMPVTATIADLRIALNADMDAEHKTEVDIIKKELGW